MIDVTYLKAHRTATNMGIKKGDEPLERLPVACTIDPSNHWRRSERQWRMMSDWADQGRHEYDASCGQ